ncbi:MAG: hypothetical protein J1E16_10835 [Muribaculaceae bacterium]|nr:hypothetical protein [Muribaculaceae bacterium]
MDILNYIKSSVGSFPRNGVILCSMLIVLCSLSSCSEKDNLSLEKNDNPEGMEEITLLIPDYDGSAAQFGTRDNTSPDEGNMSNLYVIAVKYVEFKYDERGNRIDNDEYLPDEEKTAYSMLLNPEGVNFKVGDKNYKKFSFTLYPGKYRFGVVANLDLYLSRKNKISEFKSEADLNNITLNFYEDVPLLPLHLPMACLPENIKYKEYGSNEEKSVKNVEYNLISIEKSTKDQVKTKTICADMEFLCSKVRYTILFDKTPEGISEAFGSAWIRFNVDDDKKPFATKLSKQTKLFESADGNNFDGEHPLMMEGWTAEEGAKQGTTETFDDSDLYPQDDSDHSYAWWYMGINRYKWHSDGANYPTMPHYPDGQDLEAWSGTLNEWIESKQKVWQGIVYLPENLQTDINMRTVLEFPYHTKANSEDDTEEKASSENKKIILFDTINDKQYGLSSTGSNADEKYNDLNNPIQDVSQLSLGLKRNYMYDVVAKVVTPEIDEMDIRVFVSVIPWHEIDQNIQDDGGVTSDTETQSLSENINQWQDNSSINQW